MLTPFFGTRQRNDEAKEWKIEDGDGVQGNGIGHDLVLIRRFSVYEQIWYETVSVRKVVFCLLE